MLPLITKLYDHQTQLTYRLASNQYKEVVVRTKASEALQFPTFCDSFKLVQRAFHAGSITFFEINSETL